MGTFTKEPLREIAVEAEHLEPGREVLLHKPAVNRTCVRAVQLSAVFCAVIVHVIYGHEFDLGLTAASAPTAVVVVDRLLQEPVLSSPANPSEFLVDHAHRDPRDAVVVAVAALPAKAALFTRSFIRLSTRRTRFVGLRWSSAASTTGALGDTNGLAHEVQTTVRIVDSQFTELDVDQIKHVRSGKLTGFSIGGSAVRKPEKIAA